MRAICGRNDDQKAVKRSRSDEVKQIMRGRELTLAGCLIMQRCVRYMLTDSNSNAMEKTLLNVYPDGEMSMLSWVRVLDWSGGAWLVWEVGLGVVRYYGG